MPILPWGAKPGSSGAVNLTGPITSVGATTSIASQTGTGTKFVVDTSPVLTGTPSTPTPTAGDSTTQIASTAFVQQAVRSTPGKEASNYATTAALPTVVYSNGTAGVGATLTGVAMGAIGIDSGSPSVGQRILVKNQVSTFQNGIYDVTATGSGIAVFVLTRSLDFNQTGDIKTGATTYVVSGTVLAATTWDVSSADSPAIGTDAITFIQSAGPGSLIAGTGISISGNTVAINTTTTVDKTTTQTLTNKTLTNPVILDGANTFGTFTVPGMSQSKITANTSNVLIVGSASGMTEALRIADGTDITKLISIGLSGATTSTTTTITASQTANRTLALPDATDTLVGRATTDTLTNKTLTSPTLTTPAIGAATGTSLSVSGQLTSTVATGTSPLAVTSTTKVTNLNAETVDGFNASATPTASTILALDSNTKLPVALSPSIRQVGWNYTTNGGSSGNGSVTVTFPTAFATAPKVLACLLGYKTGGAPSSPSDFTGAFGGGGTMPILFVTSISTTVFTANINSVTGNFGASYNGFSWIAEL